MESFEDISSLVIPDWDDYAYRLHVCDFLRAQVIDDIIGDLDIPPTSSGLDAGCGIGSHIQLLLEATGCDGHVTGLDLSEKYLSYAREISDRCHISDSVTFVKGNIGELPFEDDTFDWLWSSDCAGYPSTTASPVKLTEELARVVKPGGLVCIIGWTWQQLLPGHPQLEARLDTASSLVLNSIRGGIPETHFLRAPGWFEAAGLTDVGAATYAGSVLAPLSRKEKEALLAFFDMLWSGVENEVSRKDWSEYRRLCDPSSPDFILSIPGYYAYFNYTAFSGRLPE